MIIVILWDSFGSSVASWCGKGFRTLWYEFGLECQSVRALVCLPIEIKSLAFVGTCDLMNVVLKDVSRVFILFIVQCWILIYWLMILFMHYIYHWNRVVDCYYWIDISFIKLLKLMWYWIVELLKLIIKLR